MPSAQTAAPLLSVEGVHKSFGATKVLDDFDLTLHAGDMLSLLGPSGCGKTTLLRLIAGLERADRGTIRLNGQPVDGGGTWVRPEDRQVGMVFQDWALFPHLDVGANVGYGVSRRQRPEVVATTLELVNLPGMQDRTPDTLSGGQQQRVALARALAPKPSVLLLDEPFSNLDATLRRDVRSEVRSLLQDAAMTAVFVTHDREEALVLGDRVAVMDAGRIVQSGSPEEIYHQPATPWVAAFAGAVSLYPAEADGAVAHTDFGTIPLQQPAHGPVEVAVRPEAVDVAENAGPSAGTTATARHTVVSFEFRGPDAVVVLAGPGGAHLHARVPSTQRLAPGDVVAPAYVGPPAAAFPRSDPG
ncbi:ABC transporter ATP-binding protein [Candidatus Poriferisocius sp.]|uniref:ABC transporter ATP-binding protein n=1 Tax=Candidatus Poriferisocius sp. TaxID=3101276 RepID=UPI003B5BE341